MATYTTIQKFSMKTAGSTLPSFALITVIFMFPLTIFYLVK